MAKHRAKRKKHLLIVGCTLALASLFAFLSHFVALPWNTPDESANVAITPRTILASPDTPPRPTAIELAQWKATAAALEKARAQAAAEEASRAQRAAAEKAAAEEAARRKAEAEAAAAAAIMSVDAYKGYAASKLGNEIQFSCLNEMWNHESGWRPTAQNPSSTAYGIPQFLNSTWATVGGVKTSDPYRQIDYGLIYIDKAYGNPCSAWAFWQANNYY